MPHSIEKHETWPRIFTHLNGMLKKQCFASLPSHIEITPSMRQELLCLCEQAIVINATGHSFYTVAYATLFHEIERLTKENESHKIKLPASSLKSALGRTLDLPGAMEELETLAEKVIGKVLNIADPRPADDELYFKSQVDLDILEDQIRTWVQYEYPREQVDERFSLCSNRKQRRMDSCARLLSLSPIISVCTAITIDSSCSPPRLIIAANVGNANHSMQILYHLKEKIAAIRKFLIALKNENKELVLPHLESQCTLLISELEKHSSNGLPADILLQAAIKLAHALCFESETFTEEEKSAFFNENAEIVFLFSQMEKEKLKLVAHSEARGCSSSHVFELPHLKKGNIKHLHAEQLIGYFLFKIIRIPTETPLNLGISKLCCFECFSALKTFTGVMVRGHHGQTYEGVFNLFTGETSPVSSNKTAITFPWCSPKDTPSKKEGISSPSSTTTTAPVETSSKAARQLFGLFKPTAITPPQPLITNVPL
ncbi:Uncharacterised protein (plasmid) [Legionella adelaidensis]|uniref:Uncharacterized protein n=1 Tax=Legionella adelaidensis TaxID=45056 RepID=A0A0W0R1J0_9GAMM|nr:hypothetical protein [Legionella adelaidensis]KTC64930.1 hypothetical protein Lade_1737 [Legionella adelaidensis]VEH85613.1 Uncharacterised protein [Legionella adelaidensis]